MQERLLATIRQQQLMRAGERVGVAVSGGADSVALLRLLLDIRHELGVVVAVVHFNHKLRGEESDQDEAFVRALAAEHGLEYFCAAGDTRAYAAKYKCGIEAAAREMRYEFFWKLLSRGEKQQPLRSPRDAKEILPPQGFAEETPSALGALHKIATAHTLDDQAETVVLRMVRGAGTRGLAGIHPVVKPKNKKNKRSLDSGGQKRATSARDDKDSKAIVRPLLEFRRAQLRHYLRRGGQAWREDASNQDVAFARNRVRHEVMPKLRELNPAIEQVLSETAEIARAEEEYWAAVVSETLGSMQACTTGGTEEHGGMQRVPRLDAAVLSQLPTALRRRVVREFAERQGVRLEFHHVEQVLDLVSQAGSRAQKRVELPDGWNACVCQDRLWLEKRGEKDGEKDYEFSLPVPAEVRIEAVGKTLRTSQATDGARLRVSHLRVRNWRPGDRYWPAHTKEAKKVKELLQDRRIPAEARSAWPVVLQGDEIVWVPGFAYPERWRAEEGEGVVLELVP